MRRTYKLSASFFGLGQLSTVAGDYHLFLYVAPLISLVHDLYIFAEDYKVKRVGFFFRKLNKTYPGSVSNEEIEWEDQYLKEHREKWAFWASLFYTLILTVFSAFAVYTLDFQTVSSPKIYIYFLSLLCCLILIAVVFFFARSIKKEIKLIEEELK
jgi:cell division protein FtsW (lipid II flippase)